MQTILIFGGGGFMGTNFSEYFVNKNYKVISYDVIKSKIEHENLISVIGNSTDVEKIEEIFKTNKIDFVIHTLTSFWVVDGVESYQKLISENLSSTIDLLNIMDRYDVNRFIYVSSGGSIYGESNKPINEDAEKEPVSFYGWLKEAVESYISYLSRTNPKFKYIIFRPSNVYGKYQQLNRIIGVALKNAHLNEGMNIFGDINTQKDYIYIEDFCEVVFSLIEKNNWNEIYNIGSGVGVSTKDILEMAEKITGNKMEINYKETKKGDITYNVLDVDKIKNEVGKNEFLDIYAGMSKMFEYVKVELEK